MSLGIDDAGAPMESFIQSSDFDITEDSGEKVYAYPPDDP
jgi:hypothetical protein